MTAVASDSPPGALGKAAPRARLFHHSGQDEDWPAWYAACLAAEQAGTDLSA